MAERSFQFAFKGIWFNFHAHYFLNCMFLNPPLGLVTMLPALGLFPTRSGFVGIRLGI